MGDFTPISVLGFGQWSPSVSLTKTGSEWRRLHSGRPNLAVYPASCYIRRAVLRRIAAVLE